MKQTSEQVAKYDDGVGTSTNKYLALIGGVFGWGLKRNVISLYMFICRHYPNMNDPKGEPISNVARPLIYGFGFSRGSFTIRLLVGLIQSQGLVTFRSESELRRNATLAYRRYRAVAFPASKMRAPGPCIVSIARGLRDLILRTNKRYEPVARETAIRGRRDGIRIAFLGLFDTVEAYGMPVAELKTGIDRYLWPMVFCNLDLPIIVERACHALALDEERASFQPYQWDEEAESLLIKKKLVTAGRLKQVWFAGVHSNVGGGYPEDRLSYIPLEWILHEAMACNLLVDTEAVVRIEAEKSPLARMYDSRAGVGAYWRYDPRATNNYSPQGDHHADRTSTVSGVTVKRDKASAFMRMDANGVRIRPVVHHSVLTRMAFDDGYASAVLPAGFWVMNPDGELKPVGGRPGLPGPHGAIMLDMTKPSANFGVVRPSKDPALLARERADLDAAFAGIVQDSRGARANVWDTIWWRRLLNLAIAGLTILLVSFPWIGESLIAKILGEVTSDTNAKMDHIALGPISGFVETLGSFIPSYVGPWVRSIETRPVEIGILIAVLAACYQTSALLQTRIWDVARVAWNGALAPAHISATTEADAALCDRFRRFAGLSGLASILTAALFYRGEIKSLSSFGECAGITVVFILLWAWRSIAHRAWLREIAKLQTPRDSRETAPDSADPNPEPENRLPETALLKVANWCRGNAVMAALYNGFGGWVVPGGFAWIVALVAIFGAHQLVFTTMNATGQYCSPSEEIMEVKDGTTLEVSRLFSTDQFCWPSGISLKGGHRYEITMKAPEDDWFDATMRADFGGVSNTSIAHVLAWPLKRWLFQPWFQPIARVGVFGNDEFALTSVRAYDPINSKKQVDSAGQTQGLEKAACGQVKPDLPKSDTEKLSLAALKYLACQDPTPAERRTLTARFRPRQDGELFLFVNDAVLAFDAGYFYTNNSGTAKVTIARIDD